TKSNSDIIPSPAKLYPPAPQTTPTQTPQRKTTTRKNSPTFTRPTSRTSKTYSTLKNTTETPQ
ncbi:hypothetical protein, partial [Kosakonia cowanii]|uniref:hypothetical protein n=1 Tax=Kosakonia cowanii TaxID=208223 RepID=UPI0039B0EEC4